MNTLNPHPRITDQRSYEDYIKSERARLDRDHNVITSMAPLRGWEILALCRFKPGVVQFHARKIDGDGCSFQSGFAKDEVFAHLQIQSPGQ